jgi:SAM-dependent methyltransferase
MSAHHDVVRREFARQADGFGHGGSFFAAASTAEWIDAGARLAPGEIVLDAGGGAGDLSRALAARARQFVVADLTGALRDVGRDAAERDGVGNVFFVRAPWLERAHTPPADADRVREALDAELAGDGEPTGLRPVRAEDGVTRLVQRWVRLVGVRT